MQPEVPGAPAGSPSFVGRQFEIGILADALARTCAGQGGLVLVSGEPGIGKTRLAIELAARARERQMPVLWGRAWESGGAPPFWPWVQAVRALMDEVGSDALLLALGDRSRELVRLLPELAERLPRQSRPPEVEAERARFLLFDATAALLREAAGATPTLLVLDDLHAADSPSLLLLLFVARTAPASRLLVLGLMRETEIRSSPATAELFARLAREGRTLSLRGLDETEVAALAGGRAGRALTPQTVRAIHEATGGNPFFVDELVRLLLVEQGPRGIDRPAPLPIPDGVRDAIRQRCAPLAPEARDVLRLAAVLGRQFDLPVLAGLAETPAARLVELLADAIDLGLLAPVAGHPGRFRFAHVLVRDAHYEDLRPAERLRRHREAGETLERLHAGHLEPHLATIAHHHLEAAGAGDVERAAGYARRAAEHALARLAPEEAARHCELALAALAAHGSGETERVPILLVLGEAYRRAADPARARATFAEAAAAARRLGNAELLARSALGLGHSAPTESGGPDRRLVDLLEDALAAIGPAEVPLRAHLLGRLGEALYFTKARARGAALAGEAVEMARRLGRPDVLATALIRRHFTIWGPDTPDEGLALTAEAARVAASLGLREVELVATGWYVAHLLEHGDVGAADREIAGYADLADGLRLPEFRWRARLLRAARALMRGDFERAAALSREAAAIEERQGVTALQFFAVQRVALALEGGRPGALEDVVGTMGELAERFPMLPVWRSAFARVCAELGRVEEARRELDLLAADDFGGVPRDGNWFPAMMNTSETAALLADTPRAAVLYRLLEPHAHLHIVVAHSACFGSVERYLGHLAATQGNVDVAADHFARAEAADSRTGAAPFVAQTRAAWGEMLLARGAPADRARAQELLDGALATARALGIVRLVARLERLGTAPPCAVHGTHAATHRWVFRLEGEYWTVGSGEHVVRLRDARGLGYLHLLVGHPRQAFAATELVGTGRAGTGPGSPGRRGPAEPVLDERSRAEYASRLAALRTALDESSAEHDLGRIAPIEAEIEWLTTTIASAVGLGGRFRQAGSPAERARTAVTKAIRGAVRRIAEESPTLGHHLERSVRTGILCVYEPDPTQPVSWELSSAPGPPRPHGAVLRARFRPRSAR